MEVTAKCTRCLGRAIAETFAKASEGINHAVGLSRGIPCGADYGCIVEVIIETSPQEIKKEPRQNIKPKSSKSTKH